MTQRPVAVELFCGVGGMSLGFIEAGFDVVAAVDSSEDVVAVHRRNLPSCRTLVADVAELTGAEIRRLTGIGGSGIDVVFGGPPCQGFSYGGMHKRLDQRNGLIQHFARIVAELRPSYFVMENVRGLLAPRHEWRIGALRRYLRREGYELTWPLRALDASEFGVPQRRKRVFILGGKAALRRIEYPEPPVGVAPPTVWDAIGDLDTVDDNLHVVNGDEYCGRLGAPSAYAASLRVGAGTSALSGFARTAHTRNVLKRFAKTKPGEREPVSRFHRLDPDGLAFTLRAGTGPENGSFMAPRPIHPSRDRCIYPREAARLHSYPDWFTFDKTLWHSFRQIGNSVPPRLARAVAARVAEALREEAREAV